MPLGSLPIANLYTGVSQQPLTLKLPSSADAITNGWLSVVTGANKRPPSQHMANLNIPVADADDTVFGYLIDRGPDYNFLVAITKETLKVFDLQGNEQTVNFPNGVSYINQSQDPLKDFRIATVGDTSFVLNRRVPVISDDYGEEGYTSIAGAITVTNRSDIPATADLDTVYYVTSELKYYRYTHHDSTPAIYGWQITGSPVANTVNIPNGYSLPPNPVSGQVFWLTYLQRVSAGYIVWYQRYTAVITKPPGPAYDSWDVISPLDFGAPPANPDRLNPDSLATVYVTQAIANVYYTIYINNVLKAQFLTPKGVDASSSVPGTDQIADALRTNLISNGITSANVTRYGSTLSISGLQPTDTITVSASNGDKAIKQYRDAIDAFQNLPPNDVDGRVVKVAGDVTNNGDDYYVIYKDGLWVETFGFGQAAKPAANTMPHALVKEADGTWTFKEWTWQSRSAGSKDSNPDPSFIGFPINDILFYSNRMVFVADENVIMSEANHFENYYRTSLAVLVDSDPIDIAALNGGVDTLWHASPYDKDLLLLSDRNQYRLSYQNFLGPKNLQIQYTTSFSLSQDVHPINMGASVYFVDDRDDYSYAKVWEYYPKENLIGDDADDVTGPVPEYIKHGVTGIAGSTRLKTVAVISASDPGSIYLYKFYWNGEQKIQNAWGIWTMPGVSQVYWVGFSFNYLYALVNRGGGVFLERFYIEEEVSRNSDVTRYLIDRQLDKSDVTVSYDASSETSTITLPFAFIDQTIEVISNGSDYSDVRHDVEKVSNTVLKVAGYDLTAATVLKIGTPYTFSYTFPKPVMRQYTRTGEVAILDGTRLQMRYLTVQTVDTPYFTTRLSYPGRDDVVTEWDSKTIDDPRNTTGGTLGMDKTVRIPLMGNNKDMSITIENDSPWNCQLSSAEWSFTFALHSGTRMS